METEGRLPRKGRSGLVGNFVLAVASILVCVLLFEFALRVVEYRDPIAKAESRVQEYLASSSSSFVMYDSVLGWAPRPGSTSGNGLYRYESHGIRSDSADYSVEKRPGVLRIALFGDSFTHGDDVPFDSTWGRHLERTLRADGIEAEVVNFGVGGYGIDQAFLRWRTAGARFEPDIVVFGFQAENMKRAVNVFRPFYSLNTGLAFSKPRFVASDRELRLVNVPTIPPDRLVEAMRDLDGSPLERHEFFYSGGLFQSRLAELVRRGMLSHERYRAQERELYRTDGEPARLSMRIIDAFRKDVEATGATFLVAHLPTREDLAVLLEGEPLVYAEVADQLDQRHTLVRPEHRLVEAAREGGLNRLFQGHYSPAGNAIVGDVVAASVRKAVAGAASPSSR